MDEDAVRIDKWLWHARFARTRSRAQELVRGGKVRINRQKVADAARPARPGDIVTLSLPQGVAVCRVVAIAQRRGSFAEASRLYESLTPPAGDAKSP